MWFFKTNSIQIIKTIGILFLLSCIGLSLLFLLEMKDSIDYKILSKSNGFSSISICVNSFLLGVYWNIGYIRKLGCI